MKKITLALIASASFLFALPASAQDSLIEQVAMACETELTNYCGQVTPGEGRLLHCMAAHEDKLSGQCEYALYQAATILEQMGAALSYLINCCAAAIETHCSAVASGEGRLLACLDENSAAVSDTCKTAVADTIAE